MDLSRGIYNHKDIQKRYCFQATVVPNLVFIANH